MPVTCKTPTGEPRRQEQTASHLHKFGKVSPMSGTHLPFSECSGPAVSPSEALTPAVSTANGILTVTHLLASSSPTQAPVDQMDHLPRAKSEPMSPIDGESDCNSKSDSDGDSQVTSGIVESDQQGHASAGEGDTTLHRLWKVMAKYL